MYQPIYSVQPFGTVPSNLLEQLIHFYCPTAATILDATVNKGRIWGSSPNIKYIGMDIAETVRPDVVADNTKMPFADDTFDVIVYDPPHTGDQGKTKVGFGERYGVSVPTNKEGNLFHTYPPFLIEASRVLKPDGLLLVKLADCTHRATFHFATAQFWLDARATFKLQGLHILPRKNVIIDTKWKRAHHPRQNHCTWMAFTKSRVRTVEACQCAIVLSSARVINVDSERRYEEFRERMLALAATELAA
jgi:SAM-dependent methyltransferase